jgi:hypothetical protein
LYARCRASFTGRVSSITTPTSRRQPWPFADLDGILMANSLHYLRHQSAFIRKSASQLRAHHQFLIVEYDLRRGNPWVPYPLDQGAARQLFKRPRLYVALAARDTTVSIPARIALFSAGGDTPKRAREVTR